MNDTTLRPDDPKLTAYALGELDGDERAAVEVALRENPALRSVVEDIRATAQQLEAALAAESLLEPVATSSFLAKPEPTPVNGHRRLPCAASQWEIDSLPSILLRDRYARRGVFRGVGRAQPR
jgi:anti-sigma factor RsiW